MKRKIKLKDLTKEQWDENKGIECNKCERCDNCKFVYINCNTSNIKSSWINHKEIYSDKFLDQEIEIEMPDILNEAEKRYLSAVIRPFRNRVISISKYFYVLDNAYTIEICIYSSVGIFEKSVGIFEKEIIRLPLFKNEMYKGMAKNKPYTLEELEL